MGLFEFIRAYYGKITLVIGFISIIIIFIVEKKTHFFEKHIKDKVILITGIVALLVMLGFFVIMRMITRESHTLRFDDLNIISSVIALIVSMVALLIALRK